MQCSRAIFSVVYSVLQYFHIISLTARFSKKKLMEHTNRVSFSSYLAEKFLILTRLKKDIMISVRRSSCKILVILVRF